MEEKTGSEILRINKDNYLLFENIQKCGYDLGKDIYIYGLKIHELLSQNSLYNPGQLIEIILVGDNLSAIDNTINKFFHQNKKVGSTNRQSVFKIPNHYLVFSALPDFNIEKVNSEYGFTIDQLYYSVKSNKLYDPSGIGLKNFLSEPLIIKTTAEKKHWNSDLIVHFFIKFGTYYNSKIDDDDFSFFKNYDISNANLDFIFLTNRPGTLIKEMIFAFPDVKNIIFDTLLKLLSQLSLSSNENLHPKKVFSEEKLKLLDLYGDYFNSSENSSKKTKKVRTLLKVLIDS